MRRAAFAVIGVLICAPLALGGCDLKEQERLFHLSKQRTLLVDDNPLTEQQLAALRERVVYQAWPSAEGYGISPAGIYYTGGNVRPPGSPEVAPEPGAAAPR